MKSCSQYFSICLFLFILISPSHAIVNMDGIHFDNYDDKFTASFDLKLNGSTGNSETSSSALNGQFSWINPQSINLVLLGYKVGESSGQRNINKSFLHYRYIHSIREKLDWEVFTQAEQNEFTRLTFRGLLGTGVRYLARGENHNTFFGAGFFATREDIEFVSGLTDDGVREYFRGNFYILSKYKIDKKLSLSNVLYLQPRLDQPEDYRALLESSLDYSISGSVNFRLSLEVVHNSKPSQSVESTDISYMTGISLSF